MIAHRVEVHPLAGLLKAFKDVVAVLGDIPPPDAFIGNRQVGDEFFGLARLEGVLMEPAPQGRGQFRVDAVAFQVHLVIARPGGLVLVAVGRAVVIGRKLTGGRQQGDVAQVPVALAGVGKGLDGGVFVLIPRPAAELRHRTELHHRIGQ